MAPRNNTFAPTSTAFSGVVPQILSNGGLAVRALVDDAEQELTKNLFLALVDVVLPKTLCRCLLPDSFPT